MTTRIERKTFGISTGSKVISGDEVEYIVNFINDRRIVIKDSNFSGQTDVMDEHANLMEMIARALTFHDYKSWEIQAQHSLNEGESITIGPIWSKLKIGRES